MCTKTYNNYRDPTIVVVGCWSFISLRANVEFTSNEVWSLVFSQEFFLYRLYLQPFWSLQRWSEKKIWLFIREGFRSPQTFGPNKSVHFWIENVWYESFTFKLCKKPPATCQLGVPATRSLVPVSLFPINETSQDMVGRPKMPLVEFCGDGKLGILSLVPIKLFTLSQMSCSHGSHVESNWLIAFINVDHFGLRIFRDPPLGVNLFPVLCWQGQCMCHHCFLRLSWNALKVCVLSQYKSEPLEVEPFLDQPANEDD